MKKGISIISLAVTIIVMIILTGIIILSSAESVEIATATMYATEIINIQMSVDEYYYRNQKYPTTDEIEFNVTDSNQFSEETIQNGVITFKRIDLSLLGISNLEFGNELKEMDIYVLSEKTGKVYYLLGVTYEETVCYTLTEGLKKLMNNYQSDVLNENEIKKYDVIFEVSNLNYTAEPISVNVKLPIDAQIDEITATNSKSISSAITEDGYNVVKINDTSFVKEGNYIIEVSYTYQGVNKKVKYHVDNFDNTSPEISIDIIELQNSRKVTINTTDNESGIKVIKYEFGNIKEESKSYFEYYGKFLNGNVINILNEESCTIYVQDNAKNSTLLFIDAK